MAAPGWDAEIGLEQRHFFQDSLFGKPDNNVSLRGRIGTVYDFSDGQDLIEFVARTRVDERDSKRTGSDIQDLAWTHLAGDWEWRTGIRKVFWGVTESHHLVDIINQTDLAEGVTGEEKLGQPMINASWLQDWGSIDFYLLPGFRERRFPGLEGRPGALVTLDERNAQYASSPQRTDGAVRAKISLNGWEMGLSHFSGLSREPEFLQTASENVFQPYYPVIDQTGLELQYNVNAWLFKLEAITRSGMQGGRYSASTNGFEYTQTGLFDSVADLGWVVEYNFDDRKANGPDPNERDWLLATRLSVNDAANTSLFTGISIDSVSYERLLTLEMRTRLKDDWGLSVDGVFFHGDDPPVGERWEYGDEDKLWPFYHDDFIEVALVRYF